MDRRRRLLEETHTSLYHPEALQLAKSAICFYTNRRRNKLDAGGQELN
jgi:hypothetical protein